MTKYVDASPSEEIEGRLLPSDALILSAVVIQAPNERRLLCVPWTRICRLYRRSIEFFDESKDKVVTLTRLVRRRRSGPSHSTIQPSLLLSMDDLIVTADAEFSIAIVS